MDFLKEFNKTVDKMDGVGRSSQPPRYWYSTGNHVLNKIISGSFTRGIPQGRITNFSGPSASGKSFLACNAMREAQQAGAILLVIDSENALDDDFVQALGVDTEKDYHYVAVTTIEQCQAVVSSFIKGYKNEYGDDPDAPHVCIIIDSLSMLMSPSELENYGKGVQKGDMGGRNKMLKAMLRAFTQDIKALNVAIVCTSQVYADQNVFSGEKWVISDAIKYSASQIVLIDKLKLKGQTSKDIEGIRLQAQGYKTRFTKPFQKVTIEVPYDTGMDPYNGLLDAAIELGCVIKKGSRVCLEDDQDNSWFAKEFSKYQDKVLQMCEDKCDQFLEVSLQDDEIPDDSNVTASSKRKRKLDGGE